MSWLAKREDLVWQIVVAVLLFVLGSSGTVVIVIVENPIGDWLKKQVFTDSEVFKRFDQLQSYHANTAVLTVKSDGRLTEAKLRDVSTKANHFFGMEGNSKKLIDKSGHDLMKILKEYMNDEDYRAFAADQDDLFKKYGIGQEAHAKVPVVFNNDHPNNHYQNGIFLPVIVSLGSEKEKPPNESTQLIEITYLDLKPLIPVVEKYAERLKNPE